MKMYFQNYLNNLNIYRFLLIISLCCWGLSCQQPKSAAQIDIIATYGDEELSRAELEYFLPQDINAGDSVAFAQKYIDEWIQVRVIGNKARESINGLDEKVQYKLKNYEYELLAHEYAEWLIAPERMDTLVSEEDIRNYYERFSDKFISRANYFQYFHVMSTKPRQYKAVTLMNSTNAEDIEELKEWVKENAVEARLDSSFVEEGELERIGKGYNHGNIKRQPRNVVYPYQYVAEDGNKYYSFLKMIKIIRAGNPMPLSLCQERIKVEILNKKKNDMISRTTQDLADAAKKNGQAKILR